MFEFSWKFSFFSKNRKFSAVDCDLTLKLLEETKPENFNVDKNYKGPNLSLPLDRNQLSNMIEAFKVNKVRFKLRISAFYIYKVHFNHYIES